MLNELALVGALPKRKKPYWEEQAQDVAQRYPLFERPLLHDWKRVVRDAKQNAIREANKRLDKICKQFKWGDFRIDNLADEKVNDYAAAKALQCGRLLAPWERGQCETLEAAYAVDSILSYHGYAFDYEKMDSAGCLSPLLKRLQDIAWWRRQARKHAARRIEAISRELGFVNKARAMYCSDVGRQEYKRRKQLNLNMMQHTVLENEMGDQFTLADLAAVSNSNPVIRRTELMVRIAGFEQYAKSMGYEGWFYTVTCPSRYHAAHQFGGRNHKFDGSTQRDAQQYLCKLWAQFRAKAGRAGWDFFGFRVAEPHHDGTPHWHLLLFVHPDHAKAVGECLRYYAMRTDKNEAGAWKARFKAEQIKSGINPATGNEYSAAGYIAKYISKNIDGEHVDVDQYGADAKTSATSITAWASRNGIRQFQQIGGPSVSAWREFRRLGALPPEELVMQPAVVQTIVTELESRMQESAADAWAWFCQWVSDNGKVKIWQVVKTAQEIIESINEDTGEIFSNELEKPLVNHYGELINKNHGIRLMDIGKQTYVQTRFHEWKRVEVTPSEADTIHQQRTEERTSRAAAAALRRAERDAKGATAPPWTGVNNCTGDLIEQFLPEPNSNENPLQLTLIQ